MWGTAPFGNLSGKYLWLIPYTLSIFFPCQSLKHYVVEPFM